MNFVGTQMRTIETDLARMALTALSKWLAQVFYALVSRNVSGSTPTLRINLPLTRTEFSLFIEEKMCCLDWLFLKRDYLRQLSMNFCGQAVLFIWHSQVSVFVSRFVA